MAPLIQLLADLPTAAAWPAAVAATPPRPRRGPRPAGASWRPYTLGKVRDNPRMPWWVARDGVIGLLHLWRRP